MKVGGEVRRIPDMRVVADVGWEADRRDKQEQRMD